MGRSILNVSGPFCFCCSELVYFVVFCFLTTWLTCLLSCWQVHLLYCWLCYILHWYFRTQLWLPMWTKGQPSRNLWGLQHQLGTAEISSLMTEQLLGTQLLWCDIVLLWWPRTYFIISLMNPFLNYTYSINSALLENLTNILCLAHFSECNVLLTHQECHKWQNFILSMIENSILLCIYTTVYRSVVKRLDWVHSLAIVNTAARMWTCGSSRGTEFRGW